MTYKLRKPELIANIYYLSAEEGGRTMPVLSGYRGQFYYDGRNWDISQEFVDTDICEMGHSVIANITTLSPKFHYGRFFTGKPFQIREGANVVATGEIIDVLDKRFLYWDYGTFFGLLPEHITPYTKDNIQNVISLIKDIIDPAQDNNIKTIRIVQNLTCKEQMLKIDCYLTPDNQVFNKPLVRIIGDWEAVFSYRHHLYKLDLLKDSSPTYQMHFALFDTHYLTGVLNFYTVEA